MIFDGFEDIATPQFNRALKICADLGGRDLGEHSAKEWWEHRYDFYYPPLGLSLPKMYGTLETVTTFDKIEALYWAKKKAIEEGFAEWNTHYIAHFSHWFPWGVMVYDRFIIDNPPQDAHEALKLHNRLVERGAAHLAGAWRRVERASRRRPEVGPHDARAIWSGLPPHRRHQAHVRSARNHESGKAGV